MGEEGEKKKKRKRRKPSLQVGVCRLADASSLFLVWKGSSESRPSQARPHQAAMQWRV